MSVKKRVNGKWVDTSYYIYKTHTDIITTLPVSIIADGTNASVGLRGNIQQNGTPTSDTPQRVLGCGDRTANLLKLKEDYTTDVRGVSVSIKNGDITLEGTATAGGGRHIYLSENIRLPAGTYYVRGDYISGLSYHIATVSDNVSFNTSQTTSYSFTLTEEAEVALGINVIAGKTYDATVQVMLNEGETALPYEPYGYKILVETQGKNLFDKSTADVYIAFLNANDWWVTSSDGAAASVRIPVEPRTTYTLSIKPSPAIFRISESSLENPLPTSVGLITDRIVRSGSINKYTFTTSDTAKFIIFQGSFDAFDQWFNTLQLELGSISTEYEPYHEKITVDIYLDEPLYRLGDYADMLGYGAQMVTRYTKEVVLTGEENITHHRTFSGYASVRIPIIGYVRQNSRLFCTHAEQISFADLFNGTKTGIAVYNLQDLDYVLLAVDGLTSKDAYKNWLAEQYAAGTPVKVYYVLADAVSETMEIPEIPTLKGTTVLDVNTLVKPSEVSLDYTGWHPDVVHERINGVWVDKS